MTNSAKGYKKSTPKHKAIIRQIVKGKDPNQAYMQHYPESSLPSAKSSINRIMKNEENQAYLINLINNKGLSDPDLANKMYELLHAKDPITHKGQVTGEREAWEIQNKALQTALKLKGYLTEGSYTDARSINFNIEPKDTERLKAIALELRELNADSHLAYRNEEKGG